MKVKKIVKKMYKAILTRDLDQEKKLWFKALKKSMNNKHTQVIR